MSKKKWFFVIALGMAVCVTLTMAVVLIVWFIGMGNLGVDRSLPVYTAEQVDSTHPGYRRTTVTSGTNVYVRDYDEQRLQLQNFDPTNAIGRTPYGGANIYSISGQPPTAYIAVDDGSEMPAYEVFRNSHWPPFDWRHAKFQAMEYTGIIGRTEHKRTTDPALIEDVVHTLREGTPVSSPPLVVVSGTISNLYGVLLVSDQLPGLVFSPFVYKDPAGPAYLVDGIVAENAGPNQSIQARWIPASPLFTQWLQTP
jgi:hypothetical protein